MVQYITVINTSTCPLSYCFADLASHQETLSPIIIGLLITLCLHYYIVVLKLNLYVMYVRHSLHWSFVFVGTPDVRCFSRRIGKKRESEDVMAT